MVTTQIPPGEVQAGDFVHLGPLACPGDTYVPVVDAPVGKMYVQVILLGCPRWVHRLDIRSANRVIIPDVPRQQGPIINTGQGGGIGP